MAPVPLFSSNFNLLQMPYPRLYGSIDISHEGGEGLDYLPYIWIGLFVLFLIIEGITLDLVTIWFAFGALFAYLVSLLGAPFWLQLVVFLITTALMLILVFPFVRKKLHVGKYKTNVDTLPGKLAVVTEAIAFNKIGAVSVNGVLWSATGDGDFHKGETVRIQAIKGNRLIIEKAPDAPANP